MLRQVAYQMLIVSSAPLVFGLLRLLKGLRLADAARQAIVLTLVVALSALAPPLVALGVYFIFVHSIGYCLNVADRARPSESTGAPTKLWAIHIGSLPLLIPAVIVVLVVSTFFTPEIPFANRIAFASLIVYASVTLPHHLLRALNQKIPV
jgi:hypothetical protein